VSYSFVKRDMNYCFALDCVLTKKQIKNKEAGSESAFLCSRILDHLI